MVRLSRARRERCFFEAGTRGGAGSPPSIMLTLKSVRRRERSGGERAVALLRSAVRGASGAAACAALALAGLRAGFHPLLAVAAGAGFGAAARSHAAVLVLWALWRALDALDRRLARAGGR